MSLVLRILGLRASNEARFFLFVGLFGIVVAAIYWVWTYESAGSLLLAGFGGATALLGVLLAAPAAVDEGPGTRPGLDPDRPYLDETGRVPSSTLAPFALGVGLSVVLTSVVFGPAPILVGALPVLWGAASWLRGARAELAATEGKPDAE